MWIFLCSYLFGVFALTWNFIASKFYGQHFLCAGSVIIQKAWNCVNTCWLCNSHKYIDMCTGHLTHILPVWLTIYLSIHVNKASHVLNETFTDMFFSCIFSNGCTDLVPLLVSVDSLANFLVFFMFASHVLSQRQSNKPDGYGVCLVLLVYNEYNKSRAVCIIRGKHRIEANVSVFMYFR